jgi:hypothetical protein
MRYMSITAEQIARREFELLEAPDRVPVTVRVDFVDGLVLPRPEGKYEEKACSRFGLMETIKSLRRHVGILHFVRMVRIPNRRTSTRCVG